MSSMSLLSVFLLSTVVLAEAVVDRSLLLFGEKSSESLYVMDVLTTQYQRLLLPRQENPIAVAYDSTTGTVFWSSVQESHSAIKSTRLPGTNERLLRPKSISDLSQVQVGPQSAPAVVDGLAFDPVHRRVYYTDTGPQVICSMDVNGDQHRVLVQHNLLEEPRCIVVEPISRKMYWTDWGKIPHIARANMDDGSDVQILIQDNVTMVWPNGFAIDAATNEMFWCDGSLGRVEVASLTGTSRRLLSRLDGQHYFGLTIDAYHIYLSNWKYGAILRLSRSGGGMERFGPLFSGVTITGLVFIHATETQFPASSSQLPAGRPLATLSPLSPVHAPYDSGDQPQTQTANSYLGVNWTVELVAAVLGSVLLGCLVIMMILCFVIGRRTRRRNFPSPPSLTFSSLNQPAPPPSAAAAAAGGDFWSGGKVQDISTVSATAQNLQNHNLTYQSPQGSASGGAAAENFYQHMVGPGGARRTGAEGHYKGGQGQDSESQYNKLLIDFTDDDEYQYIRS